jgi:hypothetical protein
MAKATTSKKSVQEQALTSYTKANEALEVALKTLDVKKRETINEETEALRESLKQGSALEIGKHLSIVREILAPSILGKSPNSKHKKTWGVYLRASLGGFSRQTSYNWMDAYEETDKLFPRNFIMAFVESGYAVGLRISKDAPLGKYTDKAKQHTKNRDNMSLAEAEKLVPQVIAATRAQKSNRTTVTPSIIMERATDSLVNSVKAFVKKQTGDDDATQYREALEGIIGRAMDALKVADTIKVMPAKRGQAVPAHKPSVTTEVRDAIVKTFKGQHINVPLEALDAAAKAATQAAVG